MASKARAKRETLTALIARRTSKANTLKLIRSKEGLRKWDSLKSRLGEATAAAAAHSTAGGAGKRRLTFSDVDYDDNQALKLIDSIKTSPYFATLPDKAQQTILAEETNRRNKVQALETLADDEDEGAEKETLINRRLQDLQNEENRLEYIDISIINFQR